eukprot:g8901.t1
MQDPASLPDKKRDRDEAPRILIAEKHEVHQLLQEEHWTLSTSSMEAACLSTQPRFHASGLRGISLQCAHEGCESVLVGEGSRALRCGGNETAELKLHGGPWHLATSLDQGVWATRPAESTIRESARAVVPKDLMAGSQLCSWPSIPQLRTNASWIGCRMAAYWP